MLENLVSSQSGANIDILFVLYCANNLEHKMKYSLMSKKSML